jgi:hypothetical protein
MPPKLWADPVVAPPHGQAALDDLAQIASAAFATQGRGAVLLSERLPEVYYLCLADVPQAQLPGRLSGALTRMLTTYDPAHELVVVRVLRNGQTDATIFRRGGAALTA